MAAVRVLQKSKIKIEIHALTRLKTGYVERNAAYRYHGRRTTVSIESMFMKMDRQKRMYSVINVDIIELNSYIHQVICRLKVFGRPLLREALVTQNRLQPA